VARNSRHVTRGDIALLRGCLDVEPRAVELVADESHEVQYGE
jgi:hypothetical protein